MDYYRLSAVKTFFLSHEYYSDNLKQYVKDNYFPNLFYIFKINKIFIDNSYVLISKSDYDKIAEPIIPYIKSFNLSQPLKLFKLSNNSYPIFNPKNSYILKKFTRNFVSNNVKKGLKSIKSKSRLHKKHIDNLLNIENKNLVVSFDFEYNDMKISGVKEVGLTLFYPKENKFIYKYYIIEDHFSSKLTNTQLEYRFGNPIVASKHIVFNELKSILSVADYYIAHDITNELKILKMKPNWEKIIDTKSCDLNIRPKSYYLSLKDALKSYGINATHLHNAGNDSAYALQLALAMKNLI